MKITADQAQAILQAIGREDCRLRKLGITYWEGLAGVTPEEFSSLCRVDDVELCSSGRMLKWPRCIFESLCSAIINSPDSHLRIQKLNLSTNDLVLLDPTTLATAARRLKVLNLSATYLSSEQMNHLFQSISSNTELKLQSIDLSNNSLSTVDPSIFTKAILTIEKVNLSSTYLETIHLNNLFSGINNITSELSLRNLDLSSNNLRTVDPTTLYTALCKIEAVYSAETQNLVPFCQTLKLKYLNLNGNRLKYVSGTILAVCNVESLNL